jgi:hypothetical protein
MYPIFAYIGLCILESENMKTVLKLSILLLLGCKAQEKQQVASEGAQLPPNQIEKSKEASTIYSILQSAEINTSNKLLVNGREYPIAKAQAILDTIHHEYTMAIKVDTVANRKLLIINY